MALDGDFLYVADTGNHLIRRVNLKTKAVEPSPARAKTNAAGKPGRERVSV
jgi:hypothetical protein